MVTDKFTISYNGYNIDEVNSFIDEVSTNYENLLKKLNEKDKEINELKEKLSSSDNSINAAPLVGSYSSSKEEALRIIEEAKKNASRIINDALLEAEKLENRKESLRRELISFKRKARASIQVQLQNLDDLDDL